MKLPTIRIRQPDSRFDGLEGEVLLARDQWMKLVYFADERAIAFVRMPSRFNGTPRTHNGSPYYEVESFMTLPTDMNADHWMSMFMLGIA